MALALSVPAYHQSLASWLARHEAEVWAWCGQQADASPDIAPVRQDLLRHSYRLDADAHPALHDTVQAVKQALGLSDPVTLYQAHDSQMGARILVLPQEAHVVLTGPVLERLSAPELTALLGHELTHLWLLRQALPGHPASALGQMQSLVQEAADSGDPAWLETARRLSLHTELLADRGAALAAGDWRPAVQTLVKVATGTSQVDADAYLRQALELEAMDPASSTHPSHPETFLRARALALWWAHDPALPAWLQARIHGPLCLDRLDVLDQQRLCHFTGGLMRHFLAAPGAGAASAHDAHTAPATEAMPATTAVATSDIAADPTTPAADPGAPPVEAASGGTAGAPTSTSPAHPAQASAASLGQRLLDSLSPPAATVRWHEQEAVTLQVRRLFPAYDGRPGSLPDEPWPLPAQDEPDQDEASQAGSPATAAEPGTPSAHSLAQPARTNGPEPLQRPLALSLQRYANALLLDLALADPALKEEGLARAGELAARLDTLDELLKVLPRDVGLDRKAVTAFKKAHAPRKPRSRRAA